MEHMPDYFQVIEPCTVCSQTQNFGILFILFRAQAFQEETRFLNEIVSHLVIGLLVVLPPDLQFTGG